MRILFIRPRPSPETIGLQHLMIVEPLELEILATLVKDKHEVKIVDMILEKRDIIHFLHEFDPDIVCLTGYITHIPVILEYCIAVKKYRTSITTIVGGVHFEKFPEDIDSDVIDFRVVRNATHVFPLLINHLSSSSEFPAGVLKVGENLKEETLPEYDFSVPIPDRSLTQEYRNRYFYVFHNKVALIKTSFGCPFKCKFCFCRKITDDNYFTRPVVEVIDELTLIKEREIYIVDDDFLVSTERIEKFIRLLKERGLKKRFLVYGRADFIAKNAALIGKFREVGLRTIIVGLESFEDDELASFNKQTNRTINSQALQVLNQNKVDCYAAVIISPSWDKNDFKKAGDIMLNLGIKFVNLQPLTPLKGTGIHVSEKDLVVDRCDYAKWDLAHVTIRPEKMSVENFYKNILKLYLRIISNPKNLLSNLKYSLFMQIKLSKGMQRVRKQYKTVISKSVNHA
jgi:hopanoid C-3 methylase